jgi:hypothetical protein
MCLLISDMATDRELHLDADQKWKCLLKNRVTNYQHIRSPGVWKIVEVRRKRSLKVEHGRPEATGMWVLVAVLKSVTWTGNHICCVLFHSLGTESVCLQVFFWWYLVKEPAGTVIIIVLLMMMTAQYVKMLPKDVTLEKVYFILVLIHWKSTGQGTRCAMPLSVSVMWWIKFFPHIPVVNFTSGHDRIRRYYYYVEINGGN